MVTTSSTMITTFPFDSTEDVFNFLCYHSIFGSWEVYVARITAVNGMTMDLTTKTVNYNNQVSYLTFNSIKPLIKNFLDTNSYMKINLDIRLKYPDVQRHIMDVFDTYEAFWLNCYSNPLNSTFYASISFLEKAKDLSIDPITSWSVYIHSLYDDYQIFKQNG